MAAHPVEEPVDPGGKGQVAVREGLPGHLPQKRAVVREKVGVAAVPEGDQLGREARLLQQVEREEGFTLLAQVKPPHPVVRLQAVVVLRVAECSFQLVKVVDHLGPAPPQVEDHPRRRLELKRFFQVPDHLAHNGDGGPAEVEGGLDLPSEVEGEGVAAKIQAEEGQFQVHGGLQGGRGGIGEAIGADVKHQAAVLPAAEKEAGGAPFRAGVGEAVPGMEAQLHNGAEGRVDLLEKGGDPRGAIFRKGGFGRLVVSRVGWGHVIREGLGDRARGGSSVRLTVVLLLGLALTSMIGTLIPQNQSPAEYVRAYGEFLYRLFSVLNVFDMYHSWWFRFLMILLATNIIVCSVERLSATWRVIFPAAPKFSAARFRKPAGGPGWEDNRPPDELADLCRPVVAGHFGTVRVEPCGRGACIFGERRRWSRIGVYVVHFSVVLLLAGGLIGSFFGYEGFVNIPEGEARDRVFLRNSRQSIQLGFQIRCDDFDVSFYEGGAPKEYRSRLTILEAGGPILQKDIIVNDPLSHRGVRIYQSSYGTLPGNEFVLSLTSRETGMIYTQPAVLGQKVVIPENLGTLVIEEYREEAQFQGHAVGEAFVGTLTPGGAEPVPIILPLRFPGFDQMRKGEVVVAVAEYTPRYYTGLQVARDPGVWVVYAGFVLMILGCVITFFMPHQQVCVELAPAGSGSRVRVTGRAPKGQVAMDLKIQRIAEKLRRL